MKKDKGMTHHILCLVGNDIKEVILLLILFYI